MKERRGYLSERGELGNSIRDIGAVYEHHRTTPKRTLTDISAK